MYHNKKVVQEKKCRKHAFEGQSIGLMFLDAFDGFYFNFCDSLKISTDYEYNFECGLLKSKTRTSVSLKVSNFKGCCNKEIALIQIK